MMGGILLGKFHFSISNTLNTVLSKDLVVHILLVICLMGLLNYTHTVSVHTKVKHS